ncbi:MAG: transposase, partial [Myxococcota bacterium]|nr:transposase [Myxococcota bacterium]
MVSTALGLSGHDLIRSVLQEHLESVLEKAEQAGHPLAAHVEQTLRSAVTCGNPAYGFRRIRCAGCSLDRVVGFSCKRRGVCPSCGGRRMSQRAAWWVDRILPRVPVRQWVLSLPFPLRLRLAWDHDLRKAVLGIFLGAVFRFQCRRARQYGIPDPQCGSLTVAQNFGGSLNLNLHFHAILPDGVFRWDDRLDAPRFVSLPAPSTADVQQVVEKIATQVRRLLVRRGLMEESLEVPDEEHPFQRASAQGRVLLGERSGQRVQRVGQTWMFGPPPPRKLPRRCAVSEGFNLHAGVRIGRRQWSRLEKLCRYIARPPLAKERLSLREDGQIILKLKRPWFDGTYALLFEPEVFVERLAAIVPAPMKNMVHYHGVFASASRWRPLIVPDGVRRQKKAQERKQ